MTSGYSFSTKIWQEIPKFDVRAIVHIDSILYPHIIVSDWDHYWCLNSSICMQQRYVEGFIGKKISTEGSLNKLYCSLK
mgnify:CR=1 FL=1